MAEERKTTIPHSRNRFAEIMGAQGRRTDWLAMRIGASPSLVAMWRRGDRGIAERWYPRIAEALGVSEEELHPQ